MDKAWLHNLVQSDWLNEGAWLGVLVLTKNMLFHQPNRQHQRTGVRSRPKRIYLGAVWVSPNIMSPVPDKPRDQFGYAPSQWEESLQCKPIWDRESGAGEDSNYMRINPLWILSHVTVKCCHVIQHCEFLGNILGGQIECGMHWSKHQSHGSNLECEKNDVTTHLCQASLCGIHLSQHQSHWNNLESEKNDATTHLCQASLCGIHLSQHQSHWNNFECEKNDATTHLCQASLCGIHLSQHQSHWNNLECEKNDATTRLCQASVCRIHLSQHQSHWNNLECEKKDVTTRLFQATQCGIHWSQHQSHGSNFGVWEKWCYHMSVPGLIVWYTLLTTPISLEQLGVWEKWCYHMSVPGLTVWDTLITTPI